MVNNAYVRVVNMSDGKEIARYDLSEDSSLKRYDFAELYKKTGGSSYRSRLLWWLGRLGF